MGAVWRVSFALLIPLVLYVMWVPAVALWQLP